MMIVIIRFSGSGSSDIASRTSTTFALPTDFDFEGRVFPPEDQRPYGLDIVRFGDAYVVSLETGTVAHRPKDDPRDPPILHQAIAVREAFDPPRN